MRAETERPERYRDTRRPPVLWGLVAALVVTGLSGSAFGLTATYSSGGLNRWNTSARWTWTGGTCTNCVPGVTAAAAGATVNVGASVAIDTNIGGGSASIASITITGGTTTFTGTFTVATSGDLTLSGGSFTAGAGNVTVGGALTITSGTYTRAVAC